MSERKIETESLTKACYHIGIAKVFMEDFHRDSRMEAKNQSRLWVGKLNFLMTDIRSSITPEARQRWDEELVHGDLIFTLSISEKWIQLSPRQREVIENIAEAFIRGEEVKIIP